METLGPKANKQLGSKKGSQGIYGLCQPLVFHTLSGTRGKVTDPWKPEAANRDTRVRLDIHWASSEMDQKNFFSWQKKMKKEFVCLDLDTHIWNPILTQPAQKNHGEWIDQSINSTVTMGYPEEMK